MNEISYEQNENNCSMFQLESTSNLGGCYALYDLRLLLFRKA
jgi:hypothetical protein